MDRETRQSNKGIYEVTRTYTKHVPTRELSDLNEK
jgi:hypothetical protein